MKIIKTNKNEEILVDDEDFYFLSKYTWHTSNGYVNRSKTKYDKNYKNISMHRMIMNPPENMTVDHINFNKLDNRKENLRIVTQSENSKHKPKRKKTQKPKAVFMSKLVLHVSDEERIKIMKLFNSFKREEIKPKKELPDLTKIELDIINEIVEKYRKEK